MRYLSFLAGGRISFGVQTDRGVHDLGARAGGLFGSLEAYLAAVAAKIVPAAAAPGGTDYAFGEFRYLPVVRAPGKVLCVGLNYEEHRKETGRPESSYPAIFTRFADTLIGHEDDIVLPPVSTALDYEGELAVIIGKPGFRVPQERALDLVAGYACFNDATLRDWQRHTHQFIPGKNFPATGPLGPVLVTPDELDRFGDRTIVTTLNGAVMQSATLGDMIFPIDRVISYVSQFTRLAPGDVIATGTPGGVGFKREPQLFMKAGDTVEVAIEGVGTLRNAVRAEQAAG